MITTNNEKTSLFLGVIDSVLLSLLSCFFFLLKEFMTVCLNTVRPLLDVAVTLKQTEMKSPLDNTGRVCTDQIKINGCPFVNIQHVILVIVFRLNLGIN